MINILCKEESSACKLIEAAFQNKNIRYCKTFCAEEYSRWLETARELCNTKFDLLFLFEDPAEIKRLVGELYGVKNVVNSVLNKNLNNYFSHSISKNSHFNEITAISLPQGFEPIDKNEFVYSFWGKVDGKKLICVLDQNREAEIFLKNLISGDSTCENNLSSIMSSEYRTLCFKLFGLRAEQVVDKVNEIGFANNFHVRDDGNLDVALFIYLKPDVKSTFVDKITKTVYSEFAENIYADFDESLSGVLSHIAKLANVKIATAESLTGGMICSKIVDANGASNYLDFSFITYSDKSKQDLLGVESSSLEKYGAVSEEVAKEMAEGLRIKYLVDIAVSATGIAGPSGAKLEKPIGLVYVGISTSAYTVVYKKNFDGDRQSIRQCVANFALFSLIKAIKNI